MLKLAQHSSECDRCSVLDPMMAIMGKIAPTFDDWKQKEENLTAIQEATEILHGLEKLTKTKGWLKVH